MIIYNLNLSREALENGGAVSRSADGASSNRTADSSSRAADGSSRAHSAPETASGSKRSGSSKLPAIPKPR